MAPEVVWDELPDHPSARLRVLDPMAGSGTTLAAARLRGHEAIGYDRDPLAVLIARAWLSNIDRDEMEAKASQVLKKARSKARHLALSQAYPRRADNETKAFVRYWFDNSNRIQLAALSDTISRIRNETVRNVMWCAFSRLIITKQSGVSRAMDVSHSRPHRGWEKAPINAFGHFGRAAKEVVRAAPFADHQESMPPAAVKFGDARRLPVRDSSVDIVITSPPYLNAIDYLRGHKFSLVWMGYNLAALRALRATNVGTETAGGALVADATTDRIIASMCPVGKLSRRQAGMLRQYVRDMWRVLAEISRILRKGGRAIIVIGNSSIRETFIRNSKCVAALAFEVGLRVTGQRSRRLPENRRYLPPPGSSRAGAALKKRLRQEVILRLVKASNPIPRYDNVQSR